MPRCAASKPDGTPCERIVAASQTYCHAHDPTRREQRRQASSKAGKSKANRELVALKAQLRVLAEDLLAGRVDRGDAIAVNQIVGTLVRTLSLELKVREQLEVEERLAALESRLEDHRWQA